MKTKQTAVDYIVRELYSMMKPNDLLDIALYENIENAIKSAKLMEKEQIINAYEPKHRGGFRSNGEFFSEWLSGEKYYNETYGN